MLTLDYTPAADKGTITNTAGDDAELPLVDETNAGLMSPAEHKKLGDMPVIISGPDFDQTPSLGDIWFDTSDCPPTINIWDDCDDQANPIWRPIGGGRTPWLPAVSPNYWRQRNRQHADRDWRQRNRRRHSTNRHLFLAWPQRLHH